MQELIQTQFEIYLGGLTITADNAAELSAAMVSGLRVWLCDPTVSVQSCVSNQRGSERERE